MKKLKVVDAKKDLSFQLYTTDTGRPVMDFGGGNKLVLLHTTGKGKNRVLYFGKMPATEIIISDKRCVDCGGIVTLFGIPDKVWDGLGYAQRDYACIACVARCLNPKIILAN